MLKDSITILIEINMDFILILSLRLIFNFSLSLILIVAVIISWSSTVIVGISGRLSWITWIVICNWLTCVCTILLTRIHGMQWWNRLSLKIHDVRWWILHVYLSTLHSVDAFCLFLDDNDLCLIDKIKPFNLMFYCIPTLIPNLGWGLDLTSSVVKWEILEKFWDLKTNEK